MDPEEKIPDTVHVLARIVMGGLVSFMNQEKDSELVSDFFIRAGVIGVNGFQVPLKDS